MFCHLNSLLFIHSNVDGYLGNFQYLANNISVNILLHISSYLGKHISMGHISSNRTSKKMTIEQMKLKRPLIPYMRTDLVEK